MRVADLGTLWGTVKFFHPYLAYRAVDWDSALVAAIPKVNAATDSASYAAAIQTMLDALDDPATRIVEAPPPPPPPVGELDALSHWTADSTLVVTMNRKTMVFGFSSSGFQPERQERFLKDDEDDRTRQRLGYALAVSIHHVAETTLFQQGDRTHG